MLDSRSRCNPTRHRHFMAGPAQALGGTPPKTGYSSLLDRIDEICVNMAHVNNGGLPQYRDAVMASGSDPYGEVNTGAAYPMRYRRRRSSIDSLIQVQRSSEKQAPDIYSQSDAGVVVKGWRESRPRVARQHVHAGTVPAQPIYVGSPGLLRPPFADLLALDATSQPPECSVCLEAYTDELPGLVPRNLQCGHSFCTGEYG